MFSVVGLLHCQYPEKKTSLALLLWCLWSQGRRITPEEIDQFPTLGNLYRQYSQLLLKISLERAKVWFLLGSSSLSGLGSVIWPICTLAGSDLHPSQSPFSWGCIGCVFFWQPYLSQVPIYSRNWRGVFIWLHCLGRVVCLTRQAPVPWITSGWPITYMFSWVDQGSWTSHHWALPAHQDCLLADHLQIYLMNPGWCLWVGPLLLILS